VLAIVADRFGPPEVLRLREWPDPTPGPGEVLIGVAAAGVNPVDAGNRANGSWAGISAPVVLGSDVAGTIVGLGEGVRRFQIGDRVFAMLDFLGRQAGAYAQLVATQAESVTLIPPGIDFVAAAAVPLAAGTAYEAVVNRLSLKAGETVVIIGAAGGVGSFAVQLARESGADVIAVSSPSHWPLLGDLGASAFVDYRGARIAEKVLRQVPSGVEAVLDLVGDGSLAAMLPAIRPGGRAATTVGLDGDLEAAIDRNLTLHGVLVRPDGGRLKALAKLIETGRLHSVVDETYPLERAADAHVRLETGHGQGKLVLRVPPINPDLPGIATPESPS
jgi:NADPH2:quinone reductase